jgi:non-specific serine/threonine protein kinase
MGQNYKFGTVEVRADERQLLVDGTPATVGARAFDLLVALIERRDRVVSKNELLDTVWPGVVVEENNLQVQVSTLRKVLGNQAIATLPGRGYRFTIPLDDDASARPPGERNNLPAELNTFIGREHQMAELREALVNARLVTLTGMGGNGKSRLSLHVAAQVTSDFPDGVWLAELSPVTEGGRVAQMIAFEMGLKDEPGRPAIETLCRYVRDKHLLVILDNCEHLIEACADVARRLLLAAPRLKILASSREPLHVSGEARFPVKGLDIATEAVRLFVDRAAAVQPGFALTPSNEPVVSEICRDLDGIPLAIELAAARVGTMSLDWIAAALGEAMRILTRGDRAAPARQKTLRASIDWSYDLLSLEERSLLRRLSVFAGGWTLPAAEAVVASADLPKAQVFELLSQLVEKSLVEIEASGVRYRLNETVRQYAHEKLKPAELEAARIAYVSFFVESAERMRRNLSREHQAKTIARLDREIENLLAVNAACREVPEGRSLGLRLNRALRHYWIRGGHLTLGIGVARSALDLVDPQERSAERASALFDVGQLCAFAGQFADAKGYLEECAAIGRERGDLRSVGFALQPLGLCCLGLGEIDAARKALEEGLAIAEESGDANEMAAAFNALAQLHRTQGELEAAEPLYQKVLTLAGQQGNKDNTAIALLNLAMLWIERKSAQRARAMLDEVFRLFETTGSRANAQSVVEVCAGLAALLGRWEKTARLYGAAEAMARATGLHRDPADEAFLRPRIEHARRELGDAAFLAAESSGRALAADDALQEARASI